MKKRLIALGVALLGILTARLLEDNDLTMSLGVMMAMGGAAALLIMGYRDLTARMSKRQQWLKVLTGVVMVFLTAVMVGGVLWALLIFVLTLTKMI